MGGIIIKNYMISMSLIMISLSISFFVIGGSKMDAGSLGIVIALIGVFGALCTGILTLFKDFKKSEDVRQDTGDMKPRVQRIEEDSKKTVSVLVENINPSIKKISEISGGNADDLRILVEELNYQKRLKNESSGDKGYQKDRTINHINQLFEENVMLANQLKEKEIELSQSREVALMLKEKCELLENENLKLKEIIKEKENSQSNNWEPEQ